MYLWNSLTTLAVLFTHLLGDLASLQYCYIYNCGLASTVCEMCPCVLLHLILMRHHR